MRTKQEFVKIEKKAFNSYDFESSLYYKKNLSECELMTLIGAVLGVTITNPNIRAGCSFKIEIILNNPE